MALHANKRPKHDGFVPCGEKLWRERIDGHNKLMRNYFVENPVYPEKYFRRRFRMSTELFKKIAEEVMKHDRFFHAKEECRRRNWP